MTLALRSPARRATSRGFTLTELLIVIAIGSVVAATAVVTMPGALRASKADAEMQRLAAGLRHARDLAVTGRRNILLQFPSANEVRLARQDVGAGGVVTGTTDLETLALENRFVFHRFPETGDTPDGFGAASERDFGSALSVMFTSEGMLVDQTGDPANGTLFIAAGGDIPTARAVTVLGTTGLVSAYRWNGSQWLK